MIFTQEHEELRRTVRNFVDKEINPHVDEWEKEGRFPSMTFSRRPVSWACWASPSRRNSAAWA